MSYFLTRELISSRLYTNIYLHYVKFSLQIYLQKFSYNYEHLRNKCMTLILLFSKIIQYFQFLGIYNTYNIIYI